MRCATPSDCIFGFWCPDKDLYDLTIRLIFAVPEEDNKDLYQRIYALIRKYIDNRGYFHKWNGTSSLEKDRSDDKQLLEELPEQISGYISKWYSRYRMGNYIQEEVADCRVRLKDFYASTIKGHNLSDINYGHSRYFNIKWNLSSPANWKDSAR